MIRRESPRQYAQVLASGDTVFIEGHGQGQYIVHDDDGITVIINSEAVKIPFAGIGPGGLRKVTPVRYSSFWVR